MKKSPFELYYKSASVFNRISSFGHFPEPEPPFEFLNSKITNEIDDSYIKAVPTDQFERDFLNKSLSEELKLRQSSRNFNRTTISKDQLFYALWSAYGVRSNNTRNIPSAGGLYPLTFMALTFSVGTLQDSFYTFDPMGMCLNRDYFPIPCEIGKWFKTTLVDFSKTAAIIFIIGNWKKVCSKYGCRGYRYLLLEAGHAAQNMCLSATSMGVPHITLGGFEDDLINKHFNLNADDEGVIYTIALGKA